MRRTLPWLLGMNFSRSQEEEKSNKKSWTELFWKPKTRDEAIKDYVPEVLEESLAEQRSVLAQQTTRDVIVEHGHRVLREIENKAPTPSVFPALNKILALYGPDHIVSQRALNLLLYPGSAPQFQQTQAPELIANFNDHFKNFVDSIEQHGSYHHDVKVPLLEATAAKAQATTPGADGEAVAAPKPDAEPLDITYFVKCVAGMGLANLQIGDNNNALKCCDAALTHVIDDNRKGGILALKSGVLIKLKRFDEAVEVAKLAIAASPSNPQGYLQGAAALRLAKRTEEAIQMLTDGTASCPGHDGVQGMLEATTKAKEDADKLAASADPSAGQLVDDGRRAPRVRRLQIGH